MAKGRCLGCENLSHDTKGCKIRSANGHAFSSTLYVCMNDFEFRAATCLVRPCSIRRLLKRGTELGRKPKVVLPPTARLEGATRPQMPGELCRTTAAARGRVRHLPLAPPTKPSLLLFSESTYILFTFPPPPQSEREATFGPGALFASGAQKEDCPADVVMNRVEITASVRS